MQNPLTTCGVLAGALLPIAALAGDLVVGSWPGATVTTIMAATSQGAPTKGAYFVTFSAPGNGASCGSTHNNQLVIDISSPGGAAAAAIAQFARISGAKINAKGTGDCSVIPTYEAAASITY